MEFIESVVSTIDSIVSGSSPLKFSNDIEGSLTENDFVQEFKTPTISYLHLWKYTSSCEAFSRDILRNIESRLENAIISEDFLEFNYNIVYIIHSRKFNVSKCYSELKDTVVKNRIFYQHPKYEKLITTRIKVDLDTENEIIKVDAENIAEQAYYYHYPNEKIRTEKLAEFRKNPKSLLNIYVKDTV